jgi:hypothetical protein
VIFKGVSPALKRAAAYSLLLNVLTHTFPLSSSPLIKKKKKKKKKM